MHYSVTEHSVITGPSAAALPTDVVLPGTAFAALQGYFLRDDAVPALTYFLRQGTPCLRVGPYAGFLQATREVGMELLPKTTSDSTARSLSSARAALLRMLMSVPELVPLPLPEARLSRFAGLPFPDLLASLFLQKAIKLLHGDLQTDYRTAEAEPPYLRGRLKVPRQPLAQLLKPERLPAVFAERTRDNAPNRVLKACLRRLSPGAFGRQVRQYLFALDDIPDTLDWAEDIRQARLGGRNFQNYAWLWPWAEWLLGGRAPGASTGNDPLSGLLFSTQMLFEKYVATSLRRHLPPSCEVSVQESAHHLLQDAAGTPAHRLQPDAVIRRGNRVWVLDTKWKLVQERGTHLASTSQSDLYQLYAYGRRYAADAGQIKLALVYPQTADFSTAPLPLSYEPGLPLYLLPADLSASPAAMVRKLWGSLGEKS